MTDINIVDYIPVGKDNAVSRGYLVQVTGMTDRVMRDAIAEARKTHCIVNFGGGYYVADTAEDAERFLRQEKARAISIFTSLKGTREYLKKCQNNIANESCILK